MLAEHSLLQPGFPLVRRTFRWFTVYPVTPLDRLTAVAPGRNALSLDDLSFDMKSANEKVVTSVFQVLKDRARVLTHQDCMRRIVVNAELTANSRPFADAVQGNPGAWSIGDVVVKVIAGDPSGHRTLFHSESQSPRLCLFEQGNKMLLEIQQVLIHAEGLVPAHKATDRIDSQHYCGIKDTQHKLALLLPDRGIVVQHVVKVGEV